jgi:hypothetical protein
LGSSLSTNRIRDSRSKDLYGYAYQSFYRRYRISRREQRQCIFCFSELDCCSGIECCRAHIVYSTSHSIVHTSCFFVRLILIINTSFFFRINLLLILELPVFLFSTIVSFCARSISRSMMLGGRKSTTNRKRKKKEEDEEEEEEGNFLFLFLSLFSFSRNFLCILSSSLVLFDRIQ